MVDSRTFGSGSDNGLFQWSLLIVLGMAIPTESLAFKISFKSISVGLFNSIPSNPISLTILSLSIKGRSSLIISRPTHFFNSKDSFSSVLWNLTIGFLEGSIVPPINNPDDFKKSFLFMTLKFCCKRSEDHTSELQSRGHLEFRSLLAKN